MKRIGPILNFGSLWFAAFGLLTSVLAIWVYQTLPIATDYPWDILGSTPQYLFIARIASICLAAMGLWCCLLAIERVTFKWRLVGVVLLSLMIAAYILPIPASYKGAWLSNLSPPESWLAFILLIALYPMLIVKGKKARLALFITFSLIFIASIFVAGTLASLNMEVTRQELALTGEGVDARGLTRESFFRFVDLVSVPAIIALISILGLALCNHAGVSVLFGSRVPKGYRRARLINAPLGERLLNNLRRHGNDPAYRKSGYGVTFAHLAIIVIIPMLLDMIGCVRQYKLPLGEGSPTIAVQVVSQKQQKQRPILNPNSSIRFDLPELDEITYEKLIDQVSQAEYEADLASRGALGEGKKGDGGWPDGWPDGELRFIRIRHTGSGWNDGMAGHGDADRRFLDWFRKTTGVKFKVAREGEANRIDLLRSYHRGTQPPFLYLTGNGSFSLDSGDRDILRKYIEEGGTILVDPGNRTFAHNAARAMQQVMQGDQMRIISIGDPLFRAPFQFPDGIPMAVDHYKGDKRVRGWRKEDQKRWAIIFFPGDLNDSWKAGRSGLSEKDAIRHFQFGINVIRYAIHHYIKINREFMNN